MTPTNPHASIDLDTDLDTDSNATPIAQWQNPDLQSPAEHGKASTAGTDKLQKVLASLGLGSRRQMESIISEGRVSINGRVATLGDRVRPSDELRVDGRILKYTPEREKRRRVIAYYKPEGEICAASDPEGRPTVFERLPKLTHDRWVMVGRLDLNSTGLLLFTNDGELAHRLMHPSNEVVREYAVRVLGEVTPAIAQALTTGVTLEDGVAKFDEIREGGGEGVNKWYHVSLKEGRNREVRRLFESQGLKVSRLLRTRYGAIRLPSTLRTGRFLELDKHDIQALTQLVGLRGRRDAGLTTAVKERQERRTQNPLKARKPLTKSNSTRSASSSNRADGKPAQGQKVVKPSRASGQGVGRSPTRFDTDKSRDATRSSDSSHSRSQSHNQSHNQSQSGRGSKR